jgi:hypothetical protein
MISPAAPAVAVAWYPESVMVMTPAAVWSPYLREHSTKKKQHNRNESDNPDSPRRDRDNQPSDENDEEH